MKNHHHQQQHVRRACPTSSAFILVSCICAYYSTVFVVVAAWTINTANKHRLQNVVSLSSSSSSSSNVDVSLLLYKEQEKMLVQRGKWEGQLMTKTPTTILQANVVKKIGSGGGGFAGGGAAAAASGKKKGKGGGSSSSIKAAPQQQQQLQTQQGKAHAQVLQRDGVVRIDNIFSHDMADELRRMVYEMRAESSQAVESGQVPSLTRFADVLLKENRCDMTMPLVYSDSDSSVANHPERHAVIVAAVTQLIQNSPLGATIHALFGKDAILYELSCLMSDPGSQRQVMHPDTPYNTETGQEEAVLYTCFVALQDIDESMGPTVWLPGTHTKEMHEKFQDESPLPNVVENSDTNNNDPMMMMMMMIRPKTNKDLLLQQQPAVLGTLPKGCCGLFDSRLLHCGGANTSPNGTSRALFYCTFRNPRVKHVGNPGSIRRDLIGKFTLDELNQQLSLYNTGKANAFKPTISTTTASFLSSSSSSTSLP